MRARLRFLVWETLPEWGEVLNAMALVGWGIVLLLPTTIFTRSISYDPMRAVMGGLELWQAEIAWGIFILALGLLSTGSLLYGRRRYRRLALVLSAAFWAFVDMTFFLANPWGLTMVTYSVLFANAAWGAFRVLVALELDP